MIPGVDLRDFMGDDPVKKSNFVEKLGKAYEDIGFVAVRGHLLADETSSHLYRQCEAFFNMPYEQKAKYEIAGLHGQRGYTSFGKEHAKGRNEGDLKEFWHFGQTVIGDDPIKEEYPKNVFVDELPDFGKYGIKAYKDLEETGKYLLRAIALYLGLEETYFDAKIHHGNSILRPIYYPPITDEPKSAVRAAEHEDINLITLLMGASAEGLEVLNRQNQWVAITALPEQLVVNVGDMLQRLTNNKLKSTTHRVVNPPREKWSVPRYSIPFFLHPRSEMRLDCLSVCVDEKHPVQYEPISGGEYLNERLKEIGLKK
ncbi:MAG: 2-oxoglutarate and iron-dependent oxygenase domain-containing protein [Bacteroidota bacterium]|nr:2-oxoglutarate and iron-dependent oxygenase domain-containing protein [Bacteroidota bacterium]